jgi:hypothetical protein
MVTRTLHAGALFVGRCLDGKFTSGEIRCSNCNEVLEEEIAKAGEAYLVCSSMPKICANPVKVFIGAAEMHRWRDRSWEVIARMCKSRR